MVGTEAFLALTAHLAREIACLESLESLLTLEQRALRRLEATTLIELAERRSRVVETHLHLARERGVVLGACVPGAAPGHLSALFPHLEPDQKATLVTCQATLGDLVRRVHSLQAMNEAYARTGHQTVDQALTRLTRRRAGAESTYGANGRVATRPSAFAVREQG
jgi:flagellar biosynthesis/type III secretory pathway chaperone